MKQIISKQLYLYIFATLNFCSTYFMRNCSSIYTQSHFTKLWVMSIFASRAYLHKYILHVCIYKLDHKYTNKTAESMTVLACILSWFHIGKKCTTCVIKQALLLQSSYYITSTLTYNTIYYYKIFENLEPEADGGFKKIL